MRGRKRGCTNAGLGVAQLRVLRAMIEGDGRWSYISPVRVSSLGQTVGVLEGLERRKAVMRLSTPGVYPGEFQITDHGRDLAKDRGDAHAPVGISGERALR